MDHTDLGLTRLIFGDSPWDDGGAFFGRNIDIINHLLRVGALTHRHDGHAPIPDPTTAPTLTPSGAGGQLGADVDVYVAFTAIDADGGETLPSPVAQATTPAGLDIPAPPTGTPDYTAGDLPANVYYYAITATDGAGGETAPSDPLIVSVEPGHANGQVLLAGLETAASAVGGTGWRLYRSVNGGPYGFLAADATDTFTDDCSHCADEQLPPPDDTGSTTAATGMVAVVVDAASLPAGTVNYRIYAAPDPSFASPALLGEWPAADAGTEHDVTNFTLAAGQPPAVSTSLGGAALVKATTDIDWTGWTGGGGGGGGLTVDGNAVTGISLAGGIGEDFAASPGEAVLWVGWRNLSSNDFSYAGTLTDPNYVQQNVALDPGPFPLGEVSPDVWGALMAAAAGDDGRLAVLTGGSAASINSDSPQRSEARFFNAVADDKFGTTVKQLDIDNFIEGRVNNATGAPVLELVVVDAGVETVLASVPLSAAITSSCWLRTELNMGGDYGQVGVVGCSVYLVPPTLEIAESYGHVAAMLDADQNAKYGGGIVAGFGVRVQPAAGSNGLRATEWQGWRR